MRLGGVYETRGDSGFGDPEAVEYVGPNSYVITDERQQRLIRVRLDDDGEPRLRARREDEA